MLGQLCTSQADCLSSAMLSTTAEYALRVVVFLAEQPERFYTAADIAARTQVPTGYLYKVVQSLVRAGLLNSQRGKNGGVKLAGSAETITLYDVVHVVAPFQRICSCPLKLVEHKLALCALHQALDEGYAQLQLRLQGITLSQLLQDGRYAHFPAPALPVVDS
jgi:Rrf2 family protein